MKEYYFYLDSTPTHSYMKYLYKYPQRAYPYDDLVEQTGRRTEAISNTNFWIPESSTMIATSMSSSNTPKRLPRTS